jgi:hypothetical protein
MAGSQLHAHDGGVESSDGWAVHVLGPNMIEYVSGAAACLVNVAYSSTHRAHRIYATESLSELFPNLLEHLQSAAGMLRGHYEVV